MEDMSLAIVVYNPKTAGETVSSPENSLAVVVYEAGNSTRPKQKKRKERVKSVLKNHEPFLREELPAGTNPDSIYYKGSCMGLPKGWVIEQRPRSNGKLDQFFYAPRTGKQFRSLIQARKYVDTHPVDDGPESAEEYPWAQIISRYWRRRGNQPPEQAQPLRQFQPEPQPQEELPFDDIDGGRE